MKAYGERKGTLWFDSNDMLGGHLIDKQLTKHYKPIEVTTFDDEVRSTNSKGPFIIKPDVAGVEVPIFEGATQTLKNTAALVFEYHNFPKASPCLYVWKICEWMDAGVFRVAGMLECCYRDDGVR